MNWQKPNKPPRIKKRGLMVIHCDDGRMTDYTKWLKTIQRSIYKNDQFHATNTAVFSPCVNAGYLEEPYNGISSGYGFKIMTEKEMKYIQDNGGEILSHGKYHNYFDHTPVTQNASVGDVGIFYNRRFFHFSEGQEVFIEEGENKEYFNVVKVIKNEPSSDNQIIIDRPLQNDYTASARLHLSETSLIEMTKGHINLLARFGIECKNHINPWYRSSDLSDIYLRNNFNSIIKTSGGVEDPNSANIYSLLRCLGVENTSLDYFKTQIDKAYDLDGVAFIQGHGGDSEETLERLESIIDYAYEKGVRIVSHQEAVNHILSKQSVS